MIYRREGRAGFQNYKHDDKDVRHWSVAMAKKIEDFTEADYDVINREIQTQNDRGVAITACAFIEGRAG